MVASLTLQASSVTPGPLWVSVMLTTNIFVLTKILYHAIEDVLTNCNICVWCNFVVDSLICHSDQPIFVPKWASTWLPNQAAGVAELMATTWLECQRVHWLWILSRDMIISLTYRQVMWLHPWCSSIIARQLEHRLQFSSSAIVRTLWSLSSIGQSTPGCARERHGKCVACRHWEHVPCSFSILNGGINLEHVGSAQYTRSFVECSIALSQKSWSSW